MYRGGHGVRHRSALLGSLLAAAALYVACVDGHRASQLAHNVVSMSQGPQHPHIPNIGEKSPQSTKQHPGQNTKLGEIEPVERQLQRAARDDVKESESNEIGSRNSESAHDSKGCSLRSSSCSSSGADVSSIFCPNSHYMCPDGNTCCWMYTQCWGCCPYVNAVCCSDEVHCCPPGYTCGEEYCTCDGEIPIAFKDINGACRKPSNNLLSFLKTSYLRKNGQTP